MKCPHCHKEIVYDMEDRKKNFEESIRKANMTLFYDRKLLNDFYNYWTESGGKKMRFEKEKTWDVKLRLQRWKRTSKVYEKKEEKEGIEFNFLDTSRYRK